MSVQDVFKELRPVGFVQDFSQEIMRNIPTSLDWAEAIALTVEAAVLGKVRLLTKIGPLPLNLWNLMIGPSGLAYKSTPLNYFVYPTLAAVSELIDKPIIMPGRFSVEGMIEYLSMKFDDGERKGYPMHDEGVIVRDEFTSLFKGVHSKGYLADVLEFMSELYDGTMQKRFTRTYKLEQSENVYISLLAATTPYLFSVMERNFFIQGTGNRVLFTMFEPEVLPDIDAEEFFMSGREYRERRDEAEKFARKLGDMYHSSLQYIFPMPEAGRIWANYKMHKSETAAERYREDPQDLEYTYIQRLPEMALKLAGLATVSRAQDTIGKLEHDTLMIREDDMRWAIVKAENYMEHFRTLLGRWKIVPSPQPVKTAENELWYIVSYFSANPDQLLSQQEILTQTKFSKTRSYYELMATLVERKVLEKLEKEDIEKLPLEVRKRHDLLDFRGKPPAVYRLRKREIE